MLRIAMLSALLLSGFTSLARADDAKPLYYLRPDGTVEARVAAVESEVAALRQEVATLKAQLKAVTPATRTQRVQVCDGSTCRMVEVPLSGPSCNGPACANGACTGACGTCATGSCGVSYSRPVRAGWYPGKLLFGR
jgi:hypothetical protein